MKKNKYIPFITLFIIMLIFFIMAKANYGDDVWFKERINDNLFDYLSFRYYHWTSRLIIESLMLILLKMPKIIWCLLSAFLVSFSSFSISKLFTKFDWKSNWLVSLLVSLYPMIEMGDTGWYATSMNYLYPLAFCLFAMIPIKKVYEGENIKKMMMPLYILSLLIACNQEITCALLFGFYSIAIFYFMKNNKKSKFLYFLLFLIILNLVFIFTCPGNSARVTAEIKTWYPEYSNFNVITKSFLGFVTTILNMVCYPNLIIISIVGLLPLLNLFKEKKLLWKWFSFLPLLIIIFAGNHFSIFSNFSFITNHLHEYLTKVEEVTLCKKSILSFVVSISFLIPIIVSIYRLFDKKYLLLLILGAGLMTRMILGFSPTIYASGIRTFLFLDFSLIILLLYIIMDLKKRLKKDSYKTMIMILLFFSSIQFLNMLMQI